MKAGTMGTQTTAPLLRSHTPSERFIRMSEVSSLVGLGKTTLYKYVAERRFPAPIPLGGNRVAWLQSEITLWMSERIAARQS